MLFPEKREENGKRKEEKPPREENPGPREENPGPQKMDARYLIEILKARGINLRANGDRIRVEAAQEPDQNTKILLDEVRQHKAEILEALTQETASEILATSILAENTPDEVTQILGIWKRLFYMDLERARERSGKGGVRENLKQLRKWQEGFKK